MIDSDGCSGTSSRLRRLICHSLVKIGSTSDRVYMSADFSWVDDTLDSALSPYVEERELTDQDE